jgi:hypothetical protein
MIQKDDEAMVATKVSENKDTNSTGTELRKLKHDPQLFSLVLRYHLPSNKQMTMSVRF